MIRPCRISPSEKNLNDLMRRRYKFIIGTKILRSFIQRLLDGDWTDFDRHKRYNPDTGLFVTTQAVEWTMGR